MIKKIPILLLVLAYNMIVLGQNVSTLPYNSISNPFYWKNRKPYNGYWQQDVAYKIKATIDEKLDIIDGIETLIYTNNSPNTLDFVFFHLYQNAFQPGSYLDNLTKNNKVKTQWGSYEVQKLGTVISSLKQNRQQLKTEMDNTILKVFLAQPLLPGQNAEFEIEFLTHFDSGSNRRRMKKFNSFGSTAYNGTHFYPRISVYDQKFGWDTQQHLNREFYGDYGSFEVELTFASNYIVEATGELSNANEVLPDTLKKLLDIENFAQKPWNSRPSVIVPYRPGETKTWKYYAINVHDFAFTANPNYRIGEVTWNNIKVIALAQEQHAGYWQNAAEYGAKVLEVNSQDFGQYAYPKMVLADAEDGMEYPMLTLNRGYDPNYRAVFVHEIGHNWFFGMVGNNETYRAALDEGFTQFLTAWALEKLEGKERVWYKYPSAYQRKYYHPEKVRYTRAYRSFIEDAIDNDTRQLNTHSDDFNGALSQGGGYREVYYKTATMLYNLQYVLGDSLFSQAMQHYFHQWKFAHPYFEDFRNSIIQYTKVDLNWFFDEWLETTKTIDYAVKSVKRSKENDTYKIKFQRKELAQMPIDFQVVSKTGTKHNFHIPNTWFQKQTAATILPKWYGWGKKLNPSYVAEVKIPGGIKNVVIDTSLRLADFNLLNNALKVPVKVRFDHQLANYSSWENYELFWRPDLWYNGYDGMKLGFNINGDYMNCKHIFDASFWYNTGWGQQQFSKFQSQFDPISFRIKYNTALRSIAPDLDLFSTLKMLDGLYEAKLGLEKFNKPRNVRFYLYYKMLYRQDSSDLNYLIYPDEWQVKKQNNTLNMGVDVSYNKAIGAGKITLHSRSAAFTKDYAFSALSLQVINKKRIGKFDLRTRFFAQYLNGLAVPDETALYLAGANPETMMDNKFTRSVGFVPQQWQGFSSSINHFQEYGGLNLRGYAGYTPVEFTNDYKLRKLYKGNSGAAVNAELSFVRLLSTPYAKIKNYFALDMYLFGDAGVIDYESDAGNRLLSTLRADAGLGLNLTIKKWGILDKPSPLTIRVDFPFFLNRPPFDEADYFKFRWQIGIGKSF